MTGLPLDKWDALEASMHRLSKTWFTDSKPWRTWHCERPGVFRLDVHPDRRAWRVDVKMARDGCTDVAQTWSVWLDSSHPRPPSADCLLQALRNSNLFNSEELALIAPALRLCPWLSAP